VKGRKRHILVDTLGLLLAVIVHSANIQDRDGARYLLTYIADWLPRLDVVVADGGYTGRLVSWVRRTFGWTLTVVKRTADMVGFEVLPVRWRVERTFAWLGNYRRLRTDYEGRTEVSEAFVYVAMIHLMLRRLARESAF
jgi:putative transposase